MPAIYTTILLTEPGYGQRILRVHAEYTHDRTLCTEGIDLITGERVRAPICERWDRDTQREIKVTANGWAWHQIPVAVAERQAGLPAHSLPSKDNASRGDPWAVQRLRNPAFIATLAVLCDHPEIVFYPVDWRDWVHLEHPPESRLPGAVALEQPVQRSVSGESRHAPHTDGGDGTPELYASRIATMLDGASSPNVVKATTTYPSLSDAVLADLEHDYQQVLRWQREENPSRRLHQAPAAMPVARTLQQIRELVGFTPAVLAELDATHTEVRGRLATETTTVRPQGAVLSLF